MTDTTVITAPSLTSELYAEVQQYYAHHMHLLDAGRAQEWAQTFTEDGVFAPETAPQPVVGRAALAAALRRTHAGLVADNEVRRHWHGMVAVHPEPDGSLRVRCYALIFSTKRGAAPVPLMTCVCDDLMVRGEDGQLLVKERRVTRDGVSPMA